MPTIIIEQDAFMRMFAPMLDPTRPAEALAAVGDFFAHDAPDFTGWLEGAPWATSSPMTRPISRDG